MIYFLIYFLAAIGIIILTALAAVLLIPLHVSLQLLRQGSTTSGNLRVKWLVLTYRRKIPSGEKKREKEKKEKKRRPDLSRLPDTGNRLLESLPYLPDITRTFLRSITIERLSVDVKLGLGGPVETAVMSGYLWSLASLVNSLPKSGLSVRPNFQEEQLEGSLITDLKIRLLWVAAALVKALTKKPVRQLFTSMRRIQSD
ncbi:MAG: DUF2953 domain-containing protein [Thaumarchaeota archaeon]|nr:DUF2953 domain-containing protein [Nitrososphaerota archaeon]MCL5317646.1 DUF2953 domain-containing protein [Nitrososphaerota archaeon]